jgi:hypothetical protein
MRGESIYRLNVPQKTAMLRITAKSKVHATVALNDHCGTFGHCTRFSHIAAQYIFPKYQSSTGRSSINPALK